MEYVTECKNVTTTYCTNDLTTIRTKAGEKVKIEEQVDPDFAFAPIVPLLQHTCVETLQEHCYQEPKVTDIKTTVKRCLVRISFLTTETDNWNLQVKTFVECKQVDHTIPKIVCTQVPITFSGQCLWINYIP